MNTPTRPASPSFARTCGLAVAFVAALAVAPASAAPPAVDDATKAAARDLGKDGIALFEAGDFAGALEKLSRADALVRLPSTGLLVARALAKTGKLVEASEKYLAVTAIPPAGEENETQTRARATATQEREALAPRLPTLKVELDAELVGATVTLDGRPLPAALLGVKRPTNPGEHALAAVLEGGTWAAGRELAAARRGGEPPSASASDGTVF